MPNGRISAKCSCGATVGVCNCLSHESRPHPFKEWSGGGPVRPYCGNCGRLRNDPLHASGVTVVSASIPKQPLIAWLRKVMENTANSRAWRAGHFQKSTGELTCECSTEPLKTRPTSALSVTR